MNYFYHVKTASGQKMMMSKNLSILAGGKTLFPTAISRITKATGTIETHQAGNDQNRAVFVFEEDPAFPADYEIIHTEDTKLPVGFSKATYKYNKITKTFIKVK